MSTPAPGNGPRHTSGSGSSSDPNVSAGAGTATGPGTGTGTGSDPRQRFGRVVHRGSTGAGPHQVTATYTVRDDADGTEHDFDYSDIATEGFRTVVLGERVRYELDDHGRARYIIRLDLPEDEQFYR